MKLSKRLQAIADLIIKYKHGESLGDIGTDHAYLPCYLVNENVIQKAYACDIAKGPIQASIETIGSYHLENKVIPLPKTISPYIITPIIPMFLLFILINGIISLLYAIYILKESNTKSKII